MAPTEHPRTRTEQRLVELRRATVLLDQAHRARLCEMFLGWSWPPGHPVQAWGDAVRALLQAVEDDAQTSVRAWVRDRGDLDGG